jgi:predicted aldo/keto reductase-like oxidoreductase
MDYVNLGSSGLRVSRVCLGMMSFGKHESREWALDEAAAEPIVRRAVEGGITALHRGEQHVRVAVRQGAAPRADAFRLDAEPLQPDLP